MSNIPTSLSELSLNTVDVKTAAEMKAYLLNHLKTLSNWDEINSVLSEAGTLDFILDLIAPASEINSYYNLRSQQESFIEFANIDANIYAKARELGFRINRYTAPSIKFKYTGTPTLTLTRGTILGTYGDYDLVYFDVNNRLVEKGDIIYAYMGKFVSTSVPFDIQTEDFTVILSPSQLKSIDNQKIELSYDNVVQSKTIFPEDYLIKQNYADYSASTTESKLLIADFKSQFGLSSVLSAGFSTSVSIDYLETDGKVTELILNDIVDSENWKSLAVSSLGFECDTTKDIAANAPLIYSLMRRAITEDDFKFLFRSLPQIKDVGITPYGGSEGVFKIEFTTIGAGNYYVIVNNVSYSYQSTDPFITNDTLANIFYEQLKDNDIIIPLITGDVGSKFIELYSKSTRSFINISVSPNLTYSVITPQVTPAACLLHVRYLSASVTDNPMALSYAEYLDISSIIEFYKPVGLTLFYESATKQAVSLNYTISLVNPADLALVQEIAANVINDYDMRIDLVIDSTLLGRNIRRFANEKFGREIVKNLIDNNPIITYIDKTKYSKITSNLIFI